jgi:predicted dehydrogenase
MTRVLIAGFGSIGRRHYQNLKSKGVSDFAFYRTQRGTLDDSQIDGYPAFRNLDHALDYNPDLVVVSNPTAFHLDVALPAASHGADILLEKPISDSLERIAELRKAVNESGSKILVGFQFRFHPSLQLIHSWVREGLLGEIQFVRAHWGEHLPDWHPWEDYRESYSAKQHLGGGVVLTLSHPIDYLMWIFGGISDLRAAAGNKNTLDIEVEELVNIDLRFESGFLANIHLNYLERPPRHTLEILGSLGQISWNYQTGVLKRYLNQEKEWEVFPLPDDFTRNALFLSEIDHFLQVHRGEESPICSLDDGIKVQKILMRIKGQLQSGLTAEYPGGGGSKL